MPGFQALLRSPSKQRWAEGLSLLTSTHSTVTREPVWTAFRRTPEGRGRARDHAIVWLIEGKSGPEVAPWRYRAEATRRAWVHALHEAGLHGLARATIPGRPT